MGEPVVSDPSMFPSRTSLDPTTFSSSTFWIESMLPSCEKSSNVTVDEPPMSQKSPAPKTSPDMENES